MDAELAAHARPNAFEIDLAAIANCVRDLRALVGGPVKMFAALKSNAYGFGLVPVGKTALAAGADALSLVDRADAIALRKSGIDAPILLYAGSLIDAAAVQAIEKYDLMPTIIDNALNRRLFCKRNRANHDCSIRCARRSAASITAAVLRKPIFIGSGGSSIFMTSDILSRWEPPKSRHLYVFRHALKATAQSTASSCAAFIGSKPRAEDAVAANE